MNNIEYFKCVECNYDFSIKIQVNSFIKQIPVGSALNWPQVCPKCSSIYFKWLNYNDNYYLASN
jgi:hypothetical protein